MKPLLSMVILFTLVSSVSTWASTLTIPLNFEYLAVDGQPIQSSIFNHKAKLTLAPGEHKIAIRYHEMVPDDFSDSQNFIKSAPFIVTIDTSLNGDYRLKPADGEQVKDPQQFAKSPQVQVLTVQGRKANYQVEYTEIKERSFFARLLGDGTDVDISHASATATQMAQTTAKPTTITKQSVTTATPSEKTQAEKMLQYWWQQADEQTRKTFMGWAIKQL